MIFQSGYQNFERHAGGFRPGELTVLAVPPAMGATAFCLGMMDARNGKGDILYLSLSATAEQMVLRMKTTGIQCRPEPLNPDFLRVYHRDKRHYILHCNLPTTLELLEAIAKACAYSRPGLIIIDGLCFIGRKRKHIFDPSGAHHRTLRQLKMMAVALQRPILLVAIIKNDREERRGRLLGAEAIYEPYVDNLMVMQRYDYYDLHTDDLDEPVFPGDTDIHLLKCKWGLTASFRLRLSNTTWLMEEVSDLGI
jgi:predicted ATP-dependent serine protease